MVFCDGSFVTLVSGFAFLANLMYGSLIADFHNFTAAFSTLLRYPLGDFNYDELQTVCHQAHCAPRLLYSLSCLQHPSLTFSTLQAAAWS